MPTAMPPMKTSSFKCQPVWLVPDSAPRSTDRFLKRAFSGFGVRRLAAAFSPLCRSGLWPVPSSSFSRHSPLRGPPEQFYFLLTASWFPFLSSSYGVFPLPFPEGRTPLAEPLPLHSPDSTRLPYRRTQPDSL